MKQRTKVIALIAVVFSLVPLLFVNCGKKVEPVYRDAPSTSSSQSINTFSTNPPVMEGEIGFNFLLSQYFGPHCGGCHGANAAALMKPLFNVADPKGSYDLARITLDKADMVNRITANPFCPECTLKKDGEVYKAIMYWLDHR